MNYEGMRNENKLLTEKPGVRTTRVSTYVLCSYAYAE